MKNESSKTKTKEADNVCKSYEIWRTCKGYPGFEVSSFGNVRRARQEVYATTDDSDEKILIAVYPPKTIKPFRNGPDVPGYSLNVGYGPNKKQVEVHRLVAEAFLEKPDPNQRYVVHHIDGDPCNNHVDNLEFITYGEARKIKAEQKKDKPLKIHTGIKCTTTNQYFSSIKAVSQYFNIPYMQIRWYLTKTANDNTIPRNWEYNYSFKKVSAKEIKKSIEDGSYVNVETAGHDLITIE